MDDKANLPWSVPVSIEAIPETGGHYEIAADEPTRAAIAAWAGLQSLPEFGAAFDLVPRGAGARLTGMVKGRVGQSCVVTLEPVENRLEEPVDLLFVPTGTAGHAQGASGPEEAREPLVGGTIDLGAVATEFLVLGLDPYPRKPGVVFQPPVPAEAGSRPFDVLAALKKDQKR
jgi:hypothetical protein